MIEAMACGTPVIPYRGGAVPEVIEQGHTGFVVEGQQDAVDAVQRVSKLSRKLCREVFENGLRLRGWRMITCKYSNG